MLFRTAPAKYCLFSVASLLFLLTLPSRYTDPPAATEGMEAALDRVTTDFHHDLDKLRAAVIRYEDLAATHAHPDSLRRQHLATRRAFKRCEYLMEYLDPATVRRYFNGAPLPKTEPKVPETVVLDPVGLQVLDELVFEAELNLPAIRQQLNGLRTATDRAHLYYGGIRLQHRHVFEAWREEILRIFTLGVTGFDTPGSGASLPEAATALAGVHSSYAQYAPAVAARDAETHRQITEALTVGLEMLAGAEFDSFDRLAFLREVVNPLTGGFPAAQRSLNIETSWDNPLLPHPVSHRAESPFSEDFLNADYYARTGTGPEAERRRQLGELLFFDPVLSRDVSMSCATCHQPERAFTDGKPKSFVRNAPSLVNSVYASQYFYDLREDFLDRQIRHVVIDTLEFATDFGQIAERLGQSEEYRQLFADAYAEQPDYALSAYSISDALARYVTGLTALDSPFDRYARGETEGVDPKVRAGFNLFMGKAVCGTCHFAPTFSGLVPPFYTENETEVLGVPAVPLTENAPLDPDPGRIASGRPQDEAYFTAFSFKTPTVRNVAVTGPYMHNGVYENLNQVVDFYNRGGGKGIGIHLDHQTLPFDSLGLTAGEMQQVVTFMESLTDYQSLNRRPTALPTFPVRPEWNDRYRPTASVPRE